ncbi:MAG: phosphomannomutase/phosphoglucomutase [Wenzhouxiangella sp.]
MAKPSNTKPSAKGSKASTVKSLSLIRLLSLVAIAVGLFGLVLGAAMAYLGMQSQLALEQAGRAADEKARVVGAALNDIQAALRDGEVVSQALITLEGGSRDDLHSAFRRRGVASMIDLRAFDLAIEDIQPGLFPEPDFAAIEMMIVARRDGRAPIQVHFPGTANENIAFAQRLEREGQAVGVLLLRVPVSAVTSLVSDLGPLNYLAIVQGRGEQASPLRTLGSRTGGQLNRIAIPNSLLAVEWSRATVGGPVAGRTAVIIGAGGLLLLLLGIVVRSRTFPAASASPRPEEPADSTIAKPQEAQADIAAGAARSAEPPPSPPEPRQNPPSSPAAAVAPPANDLPDWLLDADLDAVPGTESEPKAELPEAVKTLLATAPEQDEVPKPPAEPEPPAVVPPGDDQVAPEPEAEDLALTDAIAPDAEDSDSELPRAEPPEPLDLTFDFSARTDKAAEAPADAEPDGIDDVDVEFPTDAPEDASPPAEPVAEAEPDTLPEPESEPEPKSENDSIEPVAPAVSRPSLIDAGLFRAHRIGGVVEQPLDARSATLIGQAIGSEARERGIATLVIGRDGRLFGAPLLSALGQGLRSAGIDVIDLGAVPIPALNLAAHEWTGGSAVMVTGSHLPPDQSGFVIRLAGEVLQDQAIQALHERIVQSDLASGSGSHEERNIIDHYAERIGVDIQLERPLKVVVDCGNGITGSLVPQVLGAIGADVIPLYCDVDGNFPNHLPNPADPDNLEDLILCVRNFRADLGIAFDGDGDRIGVVSPDGEVIWPDRLLMLLARDLLQRESGALVVHDVACSALLPGFIESLGGQTRIARSADSFVAEKMREESARLAGLMSGHLFIAERWYPFDDGIYAAARLLELLAADTRPVSDIIAELPTRKATPEYRRAMSEDDAADLVMALIAEGEFEDGQMTTLDGIRLDFEDGFGMMRASHRGAELVFRFEGEDAKAITRIQNLFKREIAKQTPDLKLIF